MSKPFGIRYCFLLWVGLFLTFSACTPAPANGSPIATPTRVILAQEVTTTQTPTTPSPRALPAQTFSMRGTYDHESDINSSAPNTLVHYQNSLKAQYTLQTTSGGRVVGEAQLTYSESYQIGSETCKIAYSVGPLNWNASLDGTYQVMPDGTFRFFSKPPPRKAHPMRSTNLV